MIRALSSSAEFHPRPSEPATLLIDSETVLCLTLTNKRQLDPEELDVLVSRLDPVELERFHRFRPEVKKQEFALGKALTRFALSRATGRTTVPWVFTVDRRGKPGLGPPHSSLHFNLSHTKGLLAVAVTSGHPVGIDVETIEPRSEDIARRFFAPEEVSLLESTPADRRVTLFTTLWTLKEAYMKAHGDGLSIPLESFHFELGPPTSIRFRSASGGSPEGWQFFRTLLLPSHALALAVQHDRPIRFLQDRVELRQLVEYWSRSAE